MYTTETDRMLAEGGVMQEGNTVDPVSGNDVPPGAMQEEVRDDIDASLSPGEFVLPADVVRYIGLSTLMKMRDKAKEGLKKMEEIGQMGNAEEVPNAEALHGGDKSEEMDDETFGAEVDSIMNEDMGGEEPAFAEGGYVDPANEPLYKSSPIKGFEMVTMTNESGNTIYIPHVNGKPLLSVPAGYISKKGILPTIEDPADAAAKAAAAARGASNDIGGGSGDSGGGPTTGPTRGGATPSISDEGVVTAAKTGLTDKQAGIVGSVIGLVTGIPGLGFVAKYGNQKTNEGYAKDYADVVRGIKDGEEMGIPGGPRGATAGEKGTGGQAANSGATAAASATAAGYSSEAVAAAAQAAANATLGGASAEDAAAAGRAAAATVANDIDANSRDPMSVTTPDTVSSRGMTPNTTPTTTPDTTTPDTGGTTPGGGDFGGSGYDGGMFGGAQSGDVGFAKGGFVKKKNKPAVKAKRGLASRK
jgi:hypothetical protein